MIFYFSATGNSEYVARKIAAETGDVTLSVADCLKGQTFSFDEPCEPLGIVSPTYAWGLPATVEEFLQKLTLARQPRYLFFIATYGTTPGQTGRFAAELLAPKGLTPSAKFGVKMPDTWTPLFDLSNKAKVDDRNARAELEIDRIISQIKNRAEGNFMKNQTPCLLSKAVHAMAYDAMRKTNHFSVEDTCVGCGLCVRNCPVSAIEIHNRKPEWMKEQCVMCLSCLHHCPKFAIAYGKKTKGHGQYTHPSYQQK